MTEQASPDMLDRLFVALVRSVRREQPERLATGMDVAEFLRFVPYKAVRGEIGADTDDDYGQAVTRLLAGEGGYVFADELMQDDLRAELGAKSPDLQAYRSYLNAKIALAQERVRSTLDALGPAPVASTAGAPAPAGAAPRAAAPKAAAKAPPGAPARDKPGADA
ncbi:MAG: hypothetical protein U9Q74_13530, partial [Gemmatimonadota bacterium]|nr:hypothetical protein [Gemmatimonadota bacterium]